MKLKFTGSTDKGNIRSNNQDYYHIDSEGRFFIVADGMGGHTGGEEASRIATVEIQTYLEANWQSSQPAMEILETALLKANQAILADQQINPQRADMGTTVVVVFFPVQETPLCAHVGDSRVYLFRDSELQQITEDHTWIAKAIKMHDITPEEGRLHPYRHVLSRCLGREDLQKVDIQPLDIKLGDSLLLCSDGLTEELTDQDIQSRLQQATSLDTATSSLVEGAKEQGGHDNITVVLVSVEQKD